MKASTEVVETFDLPYDYESLMHYPGHAFAKTNKNVTMFSKVSATSLQKNKIKKIVFLLFF